VRSALIASVVAGIVLTAAGPAAAHSSAPPTGAAAIAARVTGVPPARALSVGAGTAQGLKQIKGPFLRAGGKPLLLYVGAEFCSYCAAERWAIVNALGRFGTFTGLTLTASATDEAFPATPSFSFHGARYTSKYVTLQAAELSSNQRNATGNFAPLDSLTARQQNIAASLDRPPYASQRGSIPFILVAGRFVLFSSQYGPGALQGLNATQVASSLSTITSPPARGILGAANWLTASLCNVTGGKPASACKPKAIRTLQKQFLANP
jgi:Domain of unknown function (DUF929)